MQKGPRLIKLDVKASPDKASPGASFSLIVIVKDFEERTSWLHPVSGIGD